VDVLRESMDTRLRGYDIKETGMTNARCLSRESGKL